MLSLEHVDAYYGKAQALHRVTIEVGREEIVSLIGRNGAGKTTMLRVMCGLLTCSTGRRMLEGRDITAVKPHILSRMGIAYVPETRDIFPNLTVMDNLRAAQVAHKPGFWDAERVFELFPSLKDRVRSNGDTLSGGEQQMLAIGRGLLTNPRVLLLDEPTEGLAPLLVKAVKNAMVSINQNHVSVLLVEQNLKIPMEIAHSQYVIENGAIVWQGSSEELCRNRQTVEKYISL